MANRMLPQKPMLTGVAAMPDAGSSSLSAGTSTSA